MTTRLIIIPMKGIGELQCRECDFIVADELDEDGDDIEDTGGQNRWWCNAFERRIPYDEDDRSERLDICLESEVKR